MIQFNSYGEIEFQRIVLLLSVFGFVIYNIWRYMNDSLF